MLEEMLVRILAKKRGLSEEEARAFLESVKGTDEYDEIKQSLARLIDAGELIQKMPSQVQPLAIPLLMQGVGGGASSKAQKIAENVALISAAIRAASDDGSSKIIEELRKEIQELKEEKARKEYEQIVETIKTYIGELEARVAQLESQSISKSEGDEKDSIDRFERDLQKIEQTIEKLKRLGLIKEAENDLDVAKAAEILKKMGYKVEPPPSHEQIKIMLEQELKKREEEIRKQLERELGIQEKKLTMAMDLATAIIDGIIAATTSQSQGQSEVSRFTQTVRQMLGGAGGGGGGVGVREVDASGVGADKASSTSSEHSEQAG